MFSPNEKATVKIGYEAWHRLANGIPPQVLKDGQVVTIISYDEQRGMYICDANGVEVHIPDDKLTEHKEG